MSKFTLKLGALALHKYPQRGDVPAAHGWGDWDALWKRVGELVTFGSEAEAQAWINAHAVFAGGACISEV